MGAKTLGLWLHTLPHPLLFQWISIWCHESHLIMCKHQGKGAKLTFLPFFLSFSLSFSGYVWYLNMGSAGISMCVCAREKQNDWIERAVDYLDIRGSCIVIGNPFFPLCQIEENWRKNDNFFIRNECFSFANFWSFPRE